MNKYTKNQLWFNIEKAICFTVAAGFLILMLACLTTSCSTNKSFVHNKPVGKNYNTTCPAYK
jgi:hypothetical protein